MVNSTVFWRDDLQIRYDPDEVYRYHDPALLEFIKKLEQKPGRTIIALEIVRDQGDVIVIFN